MNTACKLPAIIFALIAVFLTAFCPALAETVEITHKSGASRVPLNPQKIVVFDLASLDNLTRLGVKGIAGIPDQESLPTYLKAYSGENYQKVGTLFEPDYEAVAALTPDLIIIAGRSQPKYKELTRIAPTIDLTVSNDHYLSDVEHNITLLGQIFGKEKETKSEIAALETSIAALKKKAAGKGTGLLILTTGGKISAFGPASRFGLLYDGFGVQPADPNLSVGKHGQPVSPEFLLAANPDRLFVIDRDAAIGASGQSAQQILDNALIRKTKAAQKGQIVYLDAQNWYLVGGGLSGLHETIDQLNQAYDKSGQVMP